MSKTAPISTGGFLTADVRKIRTVRWGGGFKYRLARLSEYETKQVKEAVRRLQVERELPSDSDVPDFIPPVLQVVSRRVPNTLLWILYELKDDDEVLMLWTIKTSSPDVYD